MFMEFDNHLAEGAWDLMDTGHYIPDVPELAADETEDARDELIAINN